MLHVHESNVLVEVQSQSYSYVNESHAKTKEIKNKFYEIKKDVKNGSSFSEYAEEFSMDKASAMKRNSWLN